MFCFVCFLLRALGVVIHLFAQNSFSDLFVQICLLIVAQVRLFKFVCLFSFASICWLTSLSQICLFRLLRLAQIRLLILACSALFCKELFRFQMDLLVHIRLLRFVCPECFLRFVCSDLFAKVCSVWFAQIRFLSQLTTFSHAQHQSCIAICDKHLNTGCFGASRYECHDHFCCRKCHVLPCRSIIVQLREP